MDGERRRALAATAAGVVLVVVHFAVFERFFPNSLGRVGHDYSYFLPHLLDGTYWALANGLFATPWFTPAFCGGLPKFANPQALYYSIPQLASALTDPLTGLRITLALFAGLGTFGSYRLLRRSFETDRGPALLGATLFLWNSLFWARMAVGHLTFHAFMLVPLLAWLVLAAAAGSRRARRCAQLCGAAAILAYLAMTSLPHMLLPSIAGTAALVLLRGVALPRAGDLLRGLAALALSGMLAIGLSAAKLVAMASYLEVFPRSLYPLPGVSGLGNLLAIVGRLVFGPALGDTSGILTNSRWNLKLHEFEYSVGLVPLCLLAAAAVCALASRSSSREERTPSAWSRERAFALAGLLLVLTIPLALNYYTPAWNTFLKALPFIGSGSTQLRWLAAYIPVSVCAAALALDRSRWLRDRAAPLSIAGIAVTLWFGITSDRSYYDTQPYDPSRVVAAHESARARGRPPRIRGIAERLDREGQPLLRMNRNEALMGGASALHCRETLLGYQLEHFPRGTLQRGPALVERDGRFNLKDPSCYVFPAENECRPGEHFRAERRADAEAFLGYAPFDFRRSNAQRVASALGGLSALCIVAGLGWGAADALRSRGRSRSKPT